MVGSVVDLHHLMRRVVDDVDAVQHRVLVAVAYAPILHNAGAAEAGERGSWNVKALNVGKRHHPARGWITGVDELDTRVFGDAQTGTSVCQAIAHDTAKRVTAARHIVPVDFAVENIARCLRRGSQAN